MTSTLQSGPACARVRERLDLYLDGGLAPLARARDGGHLEACAGCAGELARRRDWLESLRASLVPASADLAGLDGALLARLGHVPAPRATPWKRLVADSARRAAPAAALAAAALVVLSLLPGLLGDEALPASLDGAALRSLLERDLPRLEWSADPLGPWMVR